MKKSFFKWFIYISILFLIIILIKANYLKKPNIYSHFYIFCSFIFLFLGFISDGISWRQILKEAKYEITIQNGIISLGLSIFGKYIPGKIWLILGRAEYISANYNLPRKDISSLSLNAQFISLWTGLILGAIGVITINELGVYGISMLGLLTILTLIIFTSLLHQLAEKILKKIFRRNINIPRIKFKKVFKVLPWFMLNWIFWCISFYFLANSLVEKETTFNVAWGFGMAGSLGVLAVISPGGIGVREGLLTGYLTLAGLNIQDATTIAVISRLWFLIGEVFIFTVAFILDRMHRKQDISKILN